METFSLTEKNFKFFFSIRICHNFSPTAETFFFSTKYFDKFTLKIFFLYLCHCRMPSWIYDQKVFIRYRFFHIKSWSTKTLFLIHICTRSPCINHAHNLQQKSPQSRCLILRTTNQQLWKMSKNLRKKSILLIFF